MCAAQYVPSIQNKVGCAPPVSRSARRRKFPCVNLHATLVLEPAAPDFSTDAGNSALIVSTKSSHPRNANSRHVGPDGETRTTATVLAHHDWLTREGTPCHGGSFLDDNS